MKQRELVFRIPVRAMALAVLMLTSSPLRAQMNWVPDDRNPIGAPMDWNAIPSVLYDEENEVFRAWYSDRLDDRWNIAYAESQDGFNWEPDSPDVVLSDRSGAAWESQEKWSPCVIHDPAHPSDVVDAQGQPYAYQMWYWGSASHDGVGHIGYVVSHDGRNWDRPVREPVLRFGGPGEWDHGGVHMPSVLYDPEEGLYRMWYATATGHIGHAISANGVSWQRHDRPLELRRPGEERTINCNVLHNGTHYEMWFSILKGGRWDIHYARSLDGVTWTRPPSSRVLMQFSRPWDDGGACNPKVYFDEFDGVYMAWYTDHSSGGSRRTGMATFEPDLPRPHFQTEPKAGFLHQQLITFDGSRSNSPVVKNRQLGDFSYSWDFGDGGTDSGMTVEHAYDSPGDYRVRLTFSDGRESASIELVLRVDARPEPRFVRGDCNDDGTVNISDATCILNWLFAGGEDPGCIAATNVNGDETPNIIDATYLLAHLFGGGAAPPQPFPDCGPGTLPADESLGCANGPDC